MFQVKPEHIRRVSFSSKIYPKLKSSIGLNTDKLLASDRTDGELFCGGRSKNRDLLTYFGLIDDSSKLYTFAHLPVFRRSLRKLTNLIEKELELIGAQDVLLPTIVPQKLWHQSKRLDRQGNAFDSVYKFKDNSNNELLLGPTFEESITTLVATNDTVHDSELPLLLYQTSPKFRYEPNPRFGLIRTNEFIMNDLYSFDASIEEASKTYELVNKVYDKIFQSLGLRPEKTRSTTGSMGGDYSHEYQLSVSSGEDTIIKCNTCLEASNIQMYGEVASKRDLVCLNCGGTNTTSLQTLELGHTFLLSDIYSKPLKAKFAASGGDCNYFQMGCYGLGLTRILGAGIDLLSIVPRGESENKLVQMRWPFGVEPYKIGIVAPAKRSRVFHGGSTNFIDRLVNRVLETTKNSDIVIEDRDNDGIKGRILRLQSLGIPYIIIVGKRFLEQEPEVELLKLNSDRQEYEQLWLSEDQVCDYFLDID